MTKLEMTTGNGRGRGGGNYLTTINPLSLYEDGKTMLYSSSRAFLKRRKFPMCQNIGIQDLLRKFGNDWKLDVEFRFFIIFENGSGLNGLIPGWMAQLRRQICVKSSIPFLIISSIVSASLCLILQIMIVLNVFDQVRF